MNNGQRTNGQRTTEMTDWFNGQRTTDNGQRVTDNGQRTTDNYIPLRTHSVYSKGRGGLTLQELSAWVGWKNLPAAALTDIGNIYGWAKWKRAAAENGFSPIFGCEIELFKKIFLFLVKSRTGYWNLMEIFNRKKIEETEGLIVVLIPSPKEKDPLEGLAFVSQADF